MEAKTLKINIGRACALLGKDYSKGIHDAPENVKSDSMYKLLVKDKMIHEVVDSVKADEYTAELELELVAIGKLLEAVTKEKEKFESTVTALDAEVKDAAKEITKLKAEIKKIKK